MVEAKLRVEMLENRVGSKNPFYGSTMVKKVVEDILLHDKDTRNDIAPYGIYATIAINSKVVLGEGDKPLETKKVFDIKVSKHYLDHEGEGRRGTGSVIGRSVIINTAATVDHDNRIGDFSHISVGAHLAGAVTVGCHTWIGVGASVINNLTICGECMIGAGGVVVRDILTPGTYVGVPARPVAIQN